MGNTSRYLSLGLRWSSPRYQSIHAFISPVDTFVAGAGLHDRGRFSNPVAAQRAASLLGCSQDELQHAVFSLPTGMRRNFSGLTHMSNSAAGDSPSPPGE